MLIIIIKLLVRSITNDHSRHKNQLPFKNEENLIEVSDPNDLKDDPKLMDNN